MTWSFQLSELVLIKQGNLYSVLQNKLLLNKVVALSQKLSELLINKLSNFLTNGAKMVWAGKIVLTLDLKHRFSYMYVWFMIR